jgi:hypothetical protein
VRRAEIETGGKRGASSNPLVAASLFNGRGKALPIPITITPMAIHFHFSFFHKMRPARSMIIDTPMIIIGGPFETAGS